MEANLPAAPGRAGASTAAHSRLLLEAFESFTQASSSLEGTFAQLEERVRQLSEELETKNAQLERSLTEKHEVERYLKSVLESLPCGVVALDDRGVVTLCNPTAAQFLGVGRGGGGRSRRPRVEPEAARAYFDAWRDGHPAGREAEMTITTSAGTRILAASGTALSDASGRSLGSLHILRDVTEVKALQEQSRRRERLSAMGEMAIELAHEIRNPLGGIELFASLLEGELPAGSDARCWAENIRVGSRSLDTIVSNMLHFASPLTPAFAAVDLHGLIEEIVRFTEPIVRQRDVTFTRDLGAACATLSGDRELLKQMLLNLILNAMQAMPTRGALEIATRSVAPTAEYPAGALELRVADTGLGIPPENLSRIFDPFFTTSKSGTGLGLSVVHQIVERHSGLIRVESEVGVGTTFTITLPAGGPHTGGSAR